MDGLINSIKPLQFVDVSLTAKDQIACQKLKYHPSSDY